jgi:hypothetical protein
VGETASTWKTPLHSSDSEHEWSKIRDFKGDGQPLKIDHGERAFTPANRGDARLNSLSKASPANKGRPKARTRV